jgi:hypothetical protein
LASTSQSPVDHLLHRLQIAAAEGIDRRLHLTFDQTTHLQEARANVFKFQIELFAEVVAHWLGLVWAVRRTAGSLRRQCFGAMTQPALPGLRPRHFGVAAHQL